MRGLIFCFAIYSVSLFAQQFGNEWIDYSKTYYKFYSDYTGLLRIPYETLAASNITLQADGMHLYNRGEEIPIWISSESTLQDGDFIEFYARKNDGFFDTQLYEEPDHQPNKNVSLFTDSIGYYLMYDDSFEGQRYTMVENDTANHPPAEEFFVETIRRDMQGVVANPSLIVPSVFHRHLAVSAEFKEGYGFSSTTTDPDIPLNHFFEFINHYLSELGDSIYYRSVIYNQGCIDSCITDIDLVVYPQFDLIDSEEGEEHCIETIFYEESSQITITAEDYSYDFVLTGPQLNEIEFSVPNNELTFFQEPYTIINYTINSLVEECDQSARIYSMEIDFPRNYSLMDIEEITIPIITNSYVEFYETNKMTSPIFYDIHNRTRYTVENSEDIIAINLMSDLDFQESIGLLVNENQIINIEFIQEILFTDYSEEQWQGNYMIYTHEKLREGALDYIEEYRKYRQTDEFTSDGFSSPHETFDVTVIENGEIYDQFSYGIGQHPMSIKNLFQYLNETWSIELEHVLLLGKGLLPRDTRYINSKRENSIIPTWGFINGSDFRLMSNSIFGLEQHYSIGRIPANNGQEVKNYLDKVVSYENTDYCSYDELERVKRFFQITHAWTNLEIDYSVNSINQLNDLCENELGYSIQEIQDVCYHCGNNAPGIIADSIISMGVGVVRMVGHSVVSTTQFALADFEERFFENSDKYPFMFIQCSNSGNSFFNNANTSYAEKLLLHPEFGAVGYLGLSWWIYYGYNSNYIFDPIYNDVFLHNIDSTIGEIVRDNINELQGNADATMEYLMEILSPIYDPALHIVMHNKPDYAVALNAIDNSIENGEELMIDATIYNNNFNFSASEITYTVSIYEEITNNLVYEIQAVLAGNFDVTPLSLTINTEDYFIDQGEYLIVLTIDENEESLCTDNNVVQVSIVMSEGFDCPETNLNLESVYCLNHQIIALESPYENGVFYINDLEITEIDLSSQLVGIQNLTYEWIIDNEICIENIELEFVAAPEIINYEVIYTENGCLLEWEPVPFADGYEITINGETIPIPIGDTSILLIGAAANAYFAFGVYSDLCDAVNYTAIPTCDFNCETDWQELFPDPIQICEELDEYFFQGTGIDWQDDWVTESDTAIIDNVIQVEELNIGINTADYIHLITGCEGELIVEVIANTLTATFESDTIYVNETMEMIEPIVSSENVTFLWYDGETTPNHFIEITESGYMSVVVTDQYGCSTTGSVFVILVDGISELNQDLVIWPNPTSDFLVIESEQQIDQIVVFNAQGKAVKNYENIKVIDVQDVPVGLYYISIITGNHKFDAKFVKH